LTPFYLVIFGISLLLSFVLTRSVRSLCTRKGWVTLPTPDRHLHVMALPRLGGMAVFLAFNLSVGIALLLNLRFPGLVPPDSLKILLTILLPGTLIFVLGVYDDIRPLGPYTKFAVQAMAATILFAGGMGIVRLPVLFGDRELGWALGLPVTILWVIGITNAFNLLDGLDGLAAGSALFSTMVVFAVAVFDQRGLVALLTIALAGSILGFLRFNFNPATIFLGDCGSLFIGFILSALALQGSQKSPTVIAVAIPIVSFGLPILDTALSVLRRLIGRKPLFSGDREHIHHKLLERGLTHRQVVILLYGVSAIFALLSLFLLLPGGATLGLILVVVGTGVWFGVQQLGYLEFGEIRRVAERTLEQRSVFVNNLSIRRATENLKVARDFAEVCRVLESAFSSNDFDAFELEAKLLADDLYEIGHSLTLLTPVQTIRFQWAKPSSVNVHDDRFTWSLTLALLTADNRRRGTMKIRRLYGQRPLLVDINFLTSVFPAVLADALDRSLSSGEALSEATTLAHANPLTEVAEELPQEKRSRSRAM
jgi:UDP-GlcNAc:undecaprenyl-phosphate/decaprenyl-phosphate GlcNAc-1-phosphate transferase